MQECREVSHAARSHAMCGGSTVCTAVISIQTMARASRIFHPLPFLVVLFFVPGPSAANARLYRYDEESEVIRNADGRIRGAVSRANKDFVLGGLFPIHAGKGCASVRSTQQLAEAMLFALDTINADAQLLRGIYLGYDIRDTCFSESIGLDEALDVIISGEQINGGDCASTTSTPTLLGSGGSESESVAATVGIVGASGSKVSIPVAALGRLFQMPQVSYASSSPLLNNREQYTYFYRTTPTDSVQIEVMVDLMLWFNWSHISTVYSNDAYGQPGIAGLLQLAEVNDICIDVNEGIEENFLEDDYEMLATKLNVSTANVVVLFAHGPHVEKLLEKLRDISAGRKFIWIASDAWSQSQVISQFNDILAGMYGVFPLSPHVQEFQDYLTQLTIQSNKRNPWFPEVFASYTGCNLSLNATENDVCDQNLNITQSNYASLTIDAVYTFANALDRFLKENCDQPTFWNRADNSCSGQKRQLNGSALLEYIADGRFYSPLTGNTVQFDSEGNVEGRYAITNYQARYINSTITFGFYMAGVWDSSARRSGLNGSSISALNLSDISTLQFGIDNDGNIVFEPPESHCGRCVPGQYRRPVTSSCCSICDSCLGQNFSHEYLAPRCNSCSVLGDMWGNNPLQGSDRCVAISETFLTFSHPWSVVVIIMGLVGLLLVAGTGVAFGVYYKTPVIKSSSREQMVLLLIGIGLSFASVFIYIAPPTLGVCVIQRVAIWFCFSLMFGAVMIKILRVARIFLNKSLIKRPRCMEAYHQIIFTFLVVLGQMLLVAVSIGLELPGIRRQLRLNSADMNDFPEIVITCIPDPIPIFVLSVAYETLIIITACVLGVMSFKYPANFNEAKFISFCTFALLMIWLAFVPSYFATSSTQEIQNATTALAITMSAFAVLFCIFGRKMYIAILRPKDNKRQFTSHYTKGDNCTTAVETLTIQATKTLTGHDPTLELEDTESRGELRTKIFHWKLSESMLHIANSYIHNSYKSVKIV